MENTFLEQLKLNSSRFHAKVLLIFVVSFLYFISGTFGLSFYIAEGAATLVWPPTGLSIAAVMLFGWRIWPAIALGALLVNLYNSLPATLSMFVMLGNTLEALAAVFLLNLFCKDSYFTTMRSSIAYALACFLATTISASMGAASLWLGGEIDNQALGKIWMIWWLGDLLGASVFGTLFYLALANFPRDFFERLGKSDNRIILTYLAMTALTILISFLIFGGTLPREDVFRLIYVPGLIMLFGAVLLSQFFAIFQCFLISSIAVAGFIFSGNAAIKTQITVDMYFLYAYLLVQNNVALWISSGAKEWQGFNRRLKDASNKALLASKQKSQFLANMSHEIRTPLNGIIGMTTLMLEEDQNDSNKEKLHILRRSADNLLQVLNGALDHASIEAGKITLLEKSFDLHQLINDVCSLFKPGAEVKGLDFLCVIESDVPRFVHTDETRVRQILTNLLSNAMKFTEEGSVELRLAFREEDHAFIFHVIDSGIGINEEQLEHIFTPFVQADSSPSRRYQGTGLGLSISRSIAERLGGNLELDARYQQGTHVRMELPLKISSKEDSLRVQLSEHNPASLFNKLNNNKTILLIEDNATNALVIEKMLETLGYKVLLADNGERGFQAWCESLEQQHTIDLIIMDCHMPIVDGYKATSMIRNKEKALGLQTTPIIALTANAQKEERQRCLNAGMNDYLSKPLYLEDLKHCLWRNTRVSSSAGDAFVMH